jgi:hypothetical protein
MDDFKATYTDVTDWDIKVYQNTTGSRSKKIIVDLATEEEYFFKGSKELDTGEIRYPTEFWSEIVSSKIGQYLSFNVLDYNIGYNKNTKQKIGCLSKSMVSNSSNKLTEGVVFLTGFKPSYNPATDKKDYTFQFIRDTLLEFKHESYLTDLIGIIVFDAVIGNSDRHQENWGIIRNYEQTKKSFEREFRNPSNNWFVKLLYGIAERATEHYRVNEPSKKKSDLLLQSTLMESSFSPIYDSGCCLGREMLDDRVVKMLSDKQMQEAYIRKGTSEIHWQGSNNKLNHFDLIKKIHSSYPNVVQENVYKVLDKFDEKSIYDLVYNIDSKLPEQLVGYKLPDFRKELMVKLINLRIQKLNAFAS